MKKLFADLGFNLKNDDICELFFISSSPIRPKKIEGFANANPNELPIDEGSLPEICKEARILLSNGNLLLHIRLKEKSKCTTKFTFFACPSDEGKDKINWSGEKSSFKYLYNIEIRKGKSFSDLGIGKLKKSIFQGDVRTLFDFGLTKLLLSQ